MPRVIKEVKRKERKVVCEECGRTIAYFDNEVKEYNGTDISGGPDGSRWIVCPGEDCGKRIILESW